MNQELNNTMPGGMAMVNPAPTFGQCVAKYFRNSLDFDGRARRSEYWNVYLFNIITLGLLYPITIISGLSLAVRRLHDTGKSGWYLLMPLIPLVGSILLLVAMLSDSDRGANKYGSSPKYDPQPAKPEGTPSTPLFKAWIDSMKNIFNFKGRARTSDFWKAITVGYMVFLLFVLLLIIVGSTIGSSSMESLSYILLPLLLIFLFSWLSLGVRRMHDIGRKGTGFLVVGAITFVGCVVSILGGLFNYTDLSGIGSGIVQLCSEIITLGFVYQFYKDSQPGSNEWGTSSKYPEETTM